MSQPDDIAVSVSCPRCAGEGVQPYEYIVGAPDGIRRVPCKVCGGHCRVSQEVAADYHHWVAVKREAAKDRNSAEGLERIRKIFSGYEDWLERIRDREPRGKP